MLLIYIRYPNTSIQLQIKIINTTINIQHKPFNRIQFHPNKSHARKRTDQICTFLHNNFNTSIPNFRFVTNVTLRVENCHSFSKMKRPIVTDMRSVENFIFIPSTTYTRDFAERETVRSFASFWFQPLTTPHHVTGGVTLSASSGGGFMHNASCNLHFAHTTPLSSIPYCAIQRYDDPVRIIPVLPNVLDWDESYFVVCIM